MCTCIVHVCGLVSGSIQSTCVWRNECVHAQHVGKEGQVSDAQHVCVDGRVHAQHVCGEVNVWTYSTLVWRGECVHAQHTCVEVRLQAATCWFSSSNALVLGVKSRSLGVAASTFIC